MRKTESFLKPQATKKSKKIPLQLDMVGVKDALEEKLPSVEMKKEMPLEKATREARLRKEIKKKQMELPTQKPKDSQE
jgi:hypothetical protein